MSLRKRKMYCLMVEQPVPALGLVPGDAVIVKDSGPGQLFIHRGVAPVALAATLRHLMLALTEERLEYRPGEVHLVSGVLARMCSKAWRCPLPPEAEQRQVAFTSMGPPDVERALALLESDAPLVAGINASKLYPMDGHTPESHRYYDNRNRVQDHWPRDCRACGQEFRPANRKRRRCDQCLQRKRGGQ
jgi:hypothetical protein